ncbi:PREDICTED: receptor-like protein 12 [Lupinus angustifolius]|nr:PREDICTED: receptor-like protein 12 [Lupinus angustifolius]
MRITLLSLFSFIFSNWVYLSIHISGQCLEDQKSLLMQFKNNLKLNHESSTKLKLWNQSVDCCQWGGVTCDKEGHVTGLDLSAESISGGFDNSSSLFSLQNLQILNLAANNFNSVIPSGFNKLKELTFLNLSYSGFRGQIPIEISQLTRLVTLDISSLTYLTGQELKLENPNLRKLVQNLTNIKQLFLDGISIKSQGPEWSNVLLLLPNLQELSMSHCNLLGPLDSSLARLRNLAIVRLNQNNLSSAVPESFANFKNLTTLSLDYCGLMGTFPEKIFQVRTLSVIDISYNTNLFGSFPDFPLNGSLRSLIVSSTNFSGAFPNSIGNMMQLSKLDLSNCKFNGTLPSSLSNLAELSYLDLSSNRFTGSIPPLGLARKLTHIDLSHNDLSGEIPSFSHFEGLQNLLSIDLGYNSFNGSVPSSLFTLPSLQVIQLSNNQFSKFDEFSNVSSYKLNTLNLGNNNLSGPIPASIFRLSGLSILELSSNKFNGSMLLRMLLELRNLTKLDLSYNNLSINASVIDADLSSFPNMSNITLVSCNLKTFPAFLRYQSRLTYLDLSDNHIQGIVPNWIWKLDNLQTLNVSHNLLTELEGPLQNLSSNLVVLDLHHNQLQGPLTIFTKYAAYLDYSSNKFSSVIPLNIGDYLSGMIFLSLSNNTFHGSIPVSLCTAENLQVLDLSENKISGTIPSCLIGLSETLGVLDLKMNQLTGPIPDMFPVSCALKTIDLNGNTLDGSIPKSLANCTTLEVLNLGENKIDDVFPCFLKNISTLCVLVLRKNNLRGSIGCPDNNGTWHMLQIVDLAFNNFSGKLPGKCFTRWEAMMYEENQAESEVNHIQFPVLQYSRGGYYQDSVTVTSKGQQMTLVKILTVFTSIDFSSNKFQGEIPKELFDFKALYVLNLSNNFLSGQIPSSVGNLKQLESLDLSINSLEGKIPVEIASLSFLSFLNISFNQLSGEIPTGTQIQSFPYTSFIGNKGLCGPPLTTNCSANDNDSLTEVSKTEFDWQFVTTGVGFGFGAGLVVPALMIWERGRKWSNNRIDTFLIVLLPMFGLAYTPIGKDDDEDDDKEETNSEMSDDYNEDKDDRGYPRLRGEYCVFCSKLDITMQKVIHDPSCTCYNHTLPVSTSTHSLDSNSS